MAENYTTLTQHFASSFGNMIGKAWGKNDWRSGEMIGDLAKCETSKCGLK